MSSVRRHPGWHRQHYRDGGDGRAIVAGVLLSIFWLPVSFASMRFHVAAALVLPVLLFGYFAIGSVRALPGVETVQPLFSNVLLLGLFLVAFGMGFVGAEASGFTDAVVHRDHDPGGRQIELMARQRCMRFGQTVQRQYCEAYVAGSGSALDCGNTSATPGNGYNMTASEAGCSWVDDGPDRFNPVISVQGREFNCVEEGYIPASCPVQ